LNAFWEAGLKGGAGIGPQAEVIWNYVQKAASIDQAKAGGSALDELEAHRFLEAFDEAHTVLQMRAQLRKTGALAENERPKTVPLTHYLLFKYEVDWHRLVNAPQGDNSAQIAEAQDKLQAVQDAFDASTQADAEASAALKEAVAREAAAKESEAQALKREAEAKATEADAVARENEAKAREADAVARENEAKAREADAVAREADAVARENEAKAREADAVATETEAKAREAEAREAEAPFKVAQEEVESALAEVKRQEDAYNSKTAELKAASEEGGVVSRNRAKVQLDAHLAEDPLPLRKAKITLEAANKKAEKARAPFLAATEVASAAREKAEASRKQAEAAREQAEAARKQAEAARQQAEAARHQAEASRKQAEGARAAAEDAKARAEAAVEAAQASVREAEAYLQELLSNPGSGHGALWWIDRELTEKKKFMPVSKGGIR
jgi:hypothetical protein